MLSLFVFAVRTLFVCLSQQQLLHGAVSLTNGVVWVGPSCLLSPLMCMVSSNSLSLHHSREPRLVASKSILEELPHCAELMSAKSNCNGSMVSIILNSQLVSSVTENCKLTCTIHTFTTYEQHSWT